MVSLYPPLPIEPPSSVPNFQSHWSAFSKPVCTFHQAFRSGSDTTSSSSRAAILIIPSAPLLLLGLTVCASQVLGQRSGLPMNPYLISVPAMDVWLCQPQYVAQNPEVSSTSEVVITK